MFSCNKIKYKSILSLRKFGLFQNDTIIAASSLRKQGLNVNWRCQLYFSYYFNYCCYYPFIACYLTSNLHRYGWPLVKFTPAMTSSFWLSKVKLYTIPHHPIGPPLETKSIIHSNRLRNDEEVFSSRFCSYLCYYCSHSVRKHPY